VVTLLTTTTVSAPSFPALTGTVAPLFINSFDIPPITEGEINLNFLELRISVDNIGSDYSPTSDQGSSKVPSTFTDASPTYASTAPSLPPPSILPPTASPTSSCTSSTTTRSSSFVTTSNSTVSSTSFGALPALATAEVPTPSEIPTTTNSLISKGGIIGLTLALGVLFLASLLLFWCYRHQKRSHAKAMLIAPRLSGNTDGEASEIRAASRKLDIGASERDETRQNGIQRVASLHEPTECLHLRPLGLLRGVTKEEKDVINEPKLQGSTTFEETPTRRGFWNGTISEQMTSQQGLGCGLQDPAEAPATHAYKSRDEYLEGCRTPLHWREAFDRLDALRKDFSPAPLRVVKKSISNPSHQAQSLSPPSFKILKKSASNPSYQSQGRVTKSPDLAFSGSSSEGTAALILDPEQTRMERNRALTLAVLEGDLGVHHGTYTPSEYSRTSDGEPMQEQNDTKRDIQ
jgi:hypothetical protein